jgi:protein-L-isoaspartate(D-aspartate) O-methyltransferase
VTAAERLVAELSQVIADDRVLRAIATVPRERFVPAPLRSRAYDNHALGIACGQTISQPLVVARMTELLELRPGDRVLDVGTGSGYHAAILATLAGHVWSIERHAELSRLAGAALAAAGVQNVSLVIGDGSLGLPAEAPFDAINVAAAAPPEALGAFEEQLARGGRLVAPVSAPEQRLVLVRRDQEGRLTRQTLEEVRFVPLVRRTSRDPD